MWCQCGQWYSTGTFPKLVKFLPRCPFPFWDQLISTSHCDHVVGAMKLKLNSFAGDVLCEGHALGKREKIMASCGYLGHVSIIWRNMFPRWLGNCKRKHVRAMQMATLEYCFAASGDVEETPAYSCPPANMLMFTASSAESDGKIRRITHRAFPLSLSTRHQIENLDNATPDQEFSGCKSAENISRASMRQRSRPEWKLYHVETIWCQATGNSDYFWQGSVILQFVGEATAQLNCPACAGSGRDTWSRTPCPGMRGRGGEISVCSYIILSIRQCQWQGDQEASIVPEENPGVSTLGHGLSALLSVGTRQTPERKSPLC